MKLLMSGHEGPSISVNPEFDVDVKELTQGSSYLLSNLSRYNQWLAYQVARLSPLEGTVLDFGCGTGGFTLALSNYAAVDKVIANDVSPHVADYFSGKYGQYPKIEFSNADILLEPEKYDQMGYDIAITSNTLEHIEDDKTALRNLVKYSRQKTALVIVPAFNCLYGTCDRDGGHFRRYTKASFARLTDDAGLKIEKMRYFNMIGALAWWGQYVFLKMNNYQDESHTYSYSFFDKYVLPIYSRLESPLNCPFGLSLVAKVTG